MTRNLVDSALTLLTAVAAAFSGNDAGATWNREPLFHLSSPLQRWDGPKPERPHDQIDAADFPKAGLGWPLTVGVKAKAKELAVARLINEIASA